ncbi:HIRAN domain-containing protein [Micromonospora chokoriensis]
MAIFQRWFGGTRQATSVVTPPATGAQPSTPLLLPGDEDLEVVGESNYQEALWQVVGGRTRERVRCNVQAVLIPEADNPYDPNAISVWISGSRVGYLSRSDAADYRPGLLTLEARAGRRIALSGVVVGGGIRSDGPGMLGVWLSHNPQDFGVVQVVATEPVLQLRMRTGLSAAVATDVDDDSYDLSWYQNLPVDHGAAIKKLTILLREDPDPIDRHFMFCELERRLYRSRDAFDSALKQYDEACRQHDAEMDVIRTALFEKFKLIPLLETYTQMAIRQQKTKNWDRALWWASRGIALYGSDAARPEAVSDLEKRVAAYTRKLEGSGEQSGRRPDSEENGLAAQHSAEKQRIATAETAIMETLACHSCGGSFERIRTRGRKPTQCEACR